jgi:hypothetical protein
MENKHKYSLCIYCADIGNIRHHYKESVANSGKKRSYRVNEVLPTCTECNALLGSKNPSYEECCYFLHNKVSKRHKSIISMPDWNEDELEELDGHLKFQIKASLTMKKIHQQRLENLIENAQSNTTYEDIKNILCIEY